MTFEIGNDQIRAPRPANWLRIIAALNPLAYAVDAARAIFS